MDFELRTLEYIFISLILLIVINELYIKHKK